MKTKQVFFLAFIFALLVSMFSPVQSVSWGKIASDHTVLYLGYQSMKYTGINPETGQKEPLLIMLNDNDFFDNPELLVFIDTGFSSVQNYSLTISYFVYQENATTGERYRAKIFEDQTFNWNVTQTQRVFETKITLRIVSTMVYIEVRHLDATYLLQYKTNPLLLEQKISVKDMNRLRFRLLLEVLLAALLALVVAYGINRRAYVFDVPFSSALFVISVLLLLFSFFPFIFPTFDDFLLWLFHDNSLDLYVILLVGMVFLPVGLYFTNREHVVVKLRYYEGQHDKQYAGVYRFTHNFQFFLPQGFHASLVRFFLGPSSVSFGSFITGENGLEFSQDISKHQWDIVVSWVESDRHPYERILPVRAYNIRRPSFGVGFNWTYVFVSGVLTILFYSKLSQGFSQWLKGLLTFLLLVLFIGTVVLAVRTSGRPDPGEIQIQVESRLVMQDREKALRDLHIIEVQAIDLEMKQQIIDQMDAEFDRIADARVAERLYWLNSLSPETEIKENIERLKRRTEKPLDDTRRIALEKFAHAQKQIEETMKTAEEVLEDEREKQERNTDS